MPLKRISRGLLDALFPPICLLCGELSGGSYPHCCPACLASFEPIGDSCCTQCGEPFTVRQHPHLCLRCCVGPKRQVPCRSLYLYNGAVAQALSLLKYGKRLCVLDPIADAMIQAIGDPVLYSDVDMVVPVPASLWSLRKRGFNQAAVLADVLGKYLGIPVMRSVLSRRGQKPQVGLGRRERQRNAAASFGPGRRIAAADKKKILLFDDVYTTGATVRTCAEVLRSRGASVLILTFARRAPENIQHLLVDRSVRG